MVETFWLLKYYRNDSSLSALLQYNSVLLKLPNVSLAFHCIFICNNSNTFIYYTLDFYPARPWGALKLQIVSLKLQILAELEIIASFIGLSSVWNDGRWTRYGEVHITLGQCLCMYGKMEVQGCSQGVDMAVPLLEHPLPLHYPPPTPQESQLQRLLPKQLKVTCARSSELCTRSLLTWRVGREGASFQATQSQPWKKQQAAGLGAGGKWHGLGCITFSGRGGRRGGDITSLLALPLPLPGKIPGYGPVEISPSPSLFYPTHWKSSCCCRRQNTGGISLASGLDVAVSGQWGWGKD